MHADVVFQRAPRVTVREGDERLCRQVKNIIRPHLLQDKGYHFQPGKLRRIDLQPVPPRLDTAVRAKDGTGDLPICVFQQILRQVCSHETRDTGDEGFQVLPLLGV